MLDAYDWHQRSVTLINFPTDEVERLSKYHVDTIIEALFVYPNSLDESGSIVSAFGFESGAVNVLYKPDIIVIKSGFIGSTKFMELVRVLISNVRRFEAVVAIEAISDSIEDDIYLHQVVGAETGLHALWLRDFPGGYCVGYCVGASAQMRAAARQVAEFLTPLGAVAFGAEIVANSGLFVSPQAGRFVLIAGPNCSFAPPFEDCAVGLCVAMDLSRLRGVHWPPLGEFSPLLFRVPANVRIVDGEACDHWPLAAIDLTQCAELAEIGDYAFAGCPSLRSFRVPASVRKVGRCAFSTSGLREFDASRASPVMEDRSMEYCTHLESARFGGVHWSRSVFFA
jgi:hypothetical protein